MSNLYLIYFFLFLASYLLGSIPFAFLAGKMKGIDIRKHGSGNIGATNALRVLGKPIGVCCFLLDFLKGFFPVFLASKYLLTDYPFASVVITLGCVIGHIFTCFLKFKGGKGVATSAGTLTALAPLPVLIAFLCWIIIFKISGYVSLGSICAAVICPVLTITMKLSAKGNYPVPNIVLICFLSLIIIIRHKTNIKRLLKGEENKFRKKKEDKK
ncbi:MAG: glycerol-3-phosphate 1-O-acyltransferase PlsY [Verrucomicrobiota bacterium]|nr:glycerol-3-phosphate 1-O-acyltransferase PlsY [Verrucomicrobiota bacterium]